ncbi:hypothetical protein ACSNOI_45520 [Actinomadura kijaniata]|uniref:hypothetical protein n=1 Tax=Actinomadura kijaniata TaxID=46161 RepID=UPI003F1B114D
MTDHRSGPFEELLELAAEVDGPEFLVRVDHAAVPPEEQLRALLNEKGLMISPEQAASWKLPTTAAGFRERLHELPSADIRPTLMSIMTENLVYRSLSGPTTPERADPLVRQLVQKIGPDGKWWSNYYASGERKGAWDPVSPYTFDRAAIGVGNDVTVTLLAIDDD